jgi:hypothetical protein
MRLLVTILLFCGISRADLILHYSAPISPCVDGTGCQVSIDLDVFSLLPANFSAENMGGVLGHDPGFLQFFNPTGTIISDGVHTLGASWGTNATALIETDSAGNISVWDIFVEGPGGIDPSSGIPRNEVIDVNSVNRSYVQLTTDHRDLFAVGPGTWVVTPEPGSVICLGTAALGFGFMVWKRKRKA